MEELYVEGLALGADAGCVVTTARPASFRLL